MTVWETTAGGNPEAESKKNKDKTKFQKIKNSSFLLSCSRENPLHRPRLR